MLQLFEELFEKLHFNQREIFLINEEKVYKREEVIKLIEKNKDFNRILAIGLGNGADAGFLDEIAEITNGKADFVYDSEELQNKISENLELSLFPSATNTEIHIESEKETQISPYPLPPLLPGVVHHFFVRYSENSEGKSNVLITANIPSHDANEEIELVIIDINEMNPILSLFAHKQLKILEKNNEEMATQLSLESGTLCKYISYIGISFSFLYTNRK